MPLPLPLLITTPGLLPPLSPHLFLVWWLVSLLSRLSLSDHCMYLSASISCSCSLVCFCLLLALCAPCTPWDVLGIVLVCFWVLILAFLHVRFELCFLFALWLASVATLSCCFFVTLSFWSWTYFSFALLGFCGFRFWLIKLAFCFPISLPPLCICVWVHLLSFTHSFPL